MSSPQLGVGGCKPKPKKSSDVRLPIPPMSVNGKSVTTGVIAFGKISLKKMWRCPRPSTFADITYVMLRSFRNSARM